MHAFLEVFYPKGWTRLIAVLGIATSLHAFFLALGLLSPPLRTPMKGGQGFNGWIWGVPLKNIGQKFQHADYLAGVSLNFLAIKSLYRRPHSFCGTRHACDASANQAEF
jgi:hypothetical protein